MPCEACNAQFNVFRRKKSCTECRRLYCNQCLVKRKEKVLCDRCVIFSTRPLSKVELLKLKPKDLIFYLQSKHVSTTGCVEKEELVNLVLIHVNSTSSYSADTESSYSNGTETEDHFSNPFDQIKQTCQSLFSSFTDKIAADLNFDLKPTNNNGNQNIFSQPRAASPRSNSSQNNLSNHSQYSPCETNSVPNNVKNILENQQPNSGLTSPVYSIHSTTSTVTSSSGPSGMSMTRPNVDSKERPKNTQMPSVHVNNKIKINRPNLEIEMASSACDCSDDEVITTFQVSYNKKNGSATRCEIHVDDAEAGPSGSSSKTGSSAMRMNKNSSDSSNASSFEELGAVGGLSSDTENWQIIGKGTLTDSPSSVNLETTITTTTTAAKITKHQDNCDASSSKSHINFNNPTFHEHHSSSNLNQTSLTNARTRRLSRRRSDSYISVGNTTTTTTRLSGTDIVDDEHELDLDTEMSRKRTKTCCQKCGKGRGNLKKHVAKFKRQLENSNATDTEIKEKLDAFLLYLENMNRNSDSDSVGETSPQIEPNNFIEERTTAIAEQVERNNQSHIDSEFLFGDNDGIHVYGMDTVSEQKPKQFISLADYVDSSDFDALSVKQLKQILMLNRVDFKGCCEKTELLDRVKRLWNDANTCPAVDKLPTDDLCKICMDAPIECVILECGHMATCTNCGKVLSECPICRQYIVRVVRFFRA